MGDMPIMPPLKEDRLGGMGEIINDTANYRNYRAALGFSFRYYSTELLRNDQIKLLSVDGVAPTVENIRDGSYPLVATAYMVTVRPRSENVRKIVDFMLSPEGQKLVEETGYIPVASTAPAE
jgi:phosphate transport system substrate-binding protein